MTRKSHFVVVAAVASVAMASRSAIADSVFSDNFDRTTLGSNYAVTSYTNNGATQGGQGGAVTDGTHGGVANALSLTNMISGIPPVSGVVTATTPMTGFGASWNSTLDSNSSDLITWTLNWTSNRTSASGLAEMGSGSYGAGFVLAGSNTNIAGAGSGYGIEIGSGSPNPDAVKLVKYTNGIAASANRTVLLTGAQDTRNINTNVEDAFSIKITLDTTTDTWSLYTRDDGTNPPPNWSDPTNTSGYVSAGSPVIDSTYTKTAMSSIGAIWSYATTANMTSSYDNLNIDVSPSTGAISTARNLVWVGSNTNWSIANNWADSGNANAASTWDSTRPDNATFDSSGATTNVTLDAAQSAGSLTINSAGYTLNGSQTLTVYGGTGAVGLSLNANATFNAPLSIAKAQIWNFASGKTLSLNTGMSGPGGIVLNATGATLALNASAPNYNGVVTVNGGTIAVNTSDSNFISGLGVGTLTLNNAILQLADGVTLGKSSSTSTSGAKVLNLNNGAIILAQGQDWIEGLSSTPAVSAIASTNVTFQTTHSTDNLEINSAIRGGSSTSVITISGPGKVILGSGAVSNSPYVGSWVVSSGILQLGPVGTIFGEPLNALGWPATSTGTGFGNPVAVNSGAILAGAMDSANGNNSPVLAVDSFRPTVTLNSGGALATSVVSLTQWGGHFVFNDGAKILGYDPSNTGAATELFINGTGNTTWNGAVTYDNGNTNGGTLVFNRSGGTVSVGAGAELNIPTGGTLNLRGTGALSDGNGNNVKLVNNGNANVSSSQTIGNVTGTGALTVTSNAIVAAGNVSQQSLSINSSSTLKLGNGTSKVSSLNLESGSTLDIAKGALVVNYSGASVSGDIRSAIIAAYDNGAWDQPGLTSSNAQADGNHFTAVGYAEASDLGVANGGTWRGQTIPGQAILVKYTYYGDSNLDGVVNLDDFSIFVDGINGLGSGWVYGDYNNDGQIDQADFALFVQGYNLDPNQNPPLSQLILSDSQLSASQKNALLSVVPEPGTLGVTVLAAGFLAGRRRRDVQEK